MYCTVRHAQNAIAMLCLCLAFVWLFVVDADANAEDKRRIRGGFEMTCDERDG